MKRNQEYTSEFRAEAVKVVLTQGLSIAEAAKRLSVAKGTLGHWVANAKTSMGSVAPGARTVTELETEVRQLRKDLAEARMERDIL
jgi:transposase